MGYLQSGRIVDHATLGANVTSDDEGRVVVTNILPRLRRVSPRLAYGDEIYRPLAAGTSPPSTVQERAGHLPPRLARAA